MVPVGSHTWHRLTWEEMVLHRLQQDFLLFFGGDPKIFDSWWKNMCKEIWYVIFWWKNMCMWFFGGKICAKPLRSLSFEENTIFSGDPQDLSQHWPCRSRREQRWGEFHQVFSSAVLNSHDSCLNVFRYIYIYNLYNYTSNSNPMIVGFTLRFFFRHHCVSCRGSHIIWNNWVGVLQRCVHFNYIQSKTSCCLRRKLRERPDVYCWTPKQTNWKQCWSGFTRWCPPVVYCKFILNKPHELWL